jgi:hypothetical protein
MHRSGSALPAAAGATAIAAAAMAVPALGQGRHHGQTAPGQAGALP